MTLLAIWSLDTYTVNYELDGGINNPLNPETYTFEESKALYDPFKLGHSFAGWFINETLVDEIPEGMYGDITLTATWIANEYTVYVVSEDESKGTVTGSGEYTYGTSVTIKATPKEHYQFAGWYQLGTLVSLEATYTFEVPASRVTYKACFALIQYNVEVKVKEGHEAKGTVTGSGYYDYGSFVTVVATPNPGYELDGWYIDGSYDCSDLELRIQIGPKDVTCEARFKPIVYKIEYNLMGGHISSSNPMSYTIEESKTIKDPEKEGYTFLGWYNNGEKIESITPGMYGDLYLIAHWIGSDIKVELDTDSSAGKVEGAGTYKCGETVTISAYANKGHSFVGWYDNWYEQGGTLISTDENYTFTVPTHDVKYYAHWSNNSYKLSIINPDPKKGTATGEGRYDYQSYFTLEATPNEGYSFAGWYLEGSLFAKTNPYTQKMYDRDLAFEVRWSNNEYNLTVESSDENKGTVQGAGSFEYTSHNYIIATPKENYDFEGWYVNDVKISSSAKYEVVMPNHDIHFVAKWKLHSYKITYNLNGGINNPGNPSTYTIEDTVTFLNPSKEGYTFVAWYKDGAERRTETLPKGSSGDVHLNARWNINDYPVYTYSSDESKGTVSGGDKRYVYNTKVTVTATPKEDCFFKGWYSDEALTNLVTTEAEYTFKQPAKILYLYAKFYNQEEEQREWDIRHGAIPSIDLDNNTVSYGLYPQTHVNDTKLIKTLESLDESYIDSRNGYYFYEDNYYVKSKSWVFIPTEYTNFKDGTQILDQEYYWYRCDPIVWDILSNNDGTYSLISREILDRDIFGSSYTYADNNYAKSSVRNWLNGAFYKSAFALGDKYIQITKVDNSASTTPCNPNKWCCEDTLDKIYLPSYVDCMNLMPSPRAQTTDWVRAKHIDFDDEFSNFAGCGIYWTRSPMEIRDIDTAVAVIYCSGASDYDYTYQEIIGIRPCMTIKIG